MTAHRAELAAWPPWIVEHLETPLEAIRDGFDASLSELGEHFTGSRLSAGAVYTGVDDADVALDELRGSLDRGCELARQARRAIENTIWED